MLSLYSWGVQGAEMKALDKAVRVLALESRVGALDLPGFCKNSHSSSHCIRWKSKAQQGCWRFSKENYNAFTIKYMHGVIFIEIYAYRCKIHTNDV